MPRSPHNPAAMSQVIAVVEAASAVTPLNLTVSATPTQTQVQSIASKLDALLTALDLPAES